VSPPKFMLARPRCWNSPRVKIDLLLGVYPKCSIEFLMHTFTMATRVPLNSSSCRGCMAVAIETFALTCLPRTTLTLPRRPASLLSRRFSTLRPTLPRRNDGPSPAIREQFLEANSETAQETLNETNASEKPWYLDVETPRHPTAIFEPPALPDVPEDAPKLVQPLVQFASTDLGLDDLNLMDLREIHPPPALGPQLMMLFGTARSERHLHVSADRLVRWLRSRGIGAHADGLLGRNELKIKLRRRARKARMLSTNTGGLRHDEDDGIRTGWVCINLGTTGWSDAEVEVIGEDGQVAGFGVPQTGTTLVVQIMTEAKRRELDLEALWSGMLEGKRLDKKFEDAHVAKSIVDASDVTQPAATTSASTTARFGSGPANSSLQQRMYSTMSSQASTARSDNLEAFEGHGTLDEKSIHRLQASRTSSLTPDGKAQTLAALEDLRRSFDQMPKEMAMEALNKSKYDREDSPASPDFFVRYITLLKTLTPADAWWSRMWLQLQARQFGHPQYRFETIHGLLADLVEGGFSASPTQFEAILAGVISAPGFESSQLQIRCKLAMSVLDIMSMRGIAVLSPSVIVTLITALLQSGATGRDVRALQERLETLLDEAEFEYMGEELLKQLLAAYALSGNWDRLWEVWRVPPKYEVGRSGQLYAFFYGLLAATNHQLRCIETLRWTVPEILHEQPAITPNAALLDAMAAVVRIADPHAEAGAARVEILINQLQRLNSEPGNRDTRLLFEEAHNLMFNEFVRLFVVVRRYGKDGSSLDNLPAFTGREIKEVMEPFQIRLRKHERQDRDRRRPSER
jgi:hypothetical protein